MRSGNLRGRLLSWPFVGRTSVYLVIWCVLALVSGCARATPMSEPATISFAFLQWEQEYYERLIAMFNEDHPHITVEPRMLRRNQELASVLGEGNVDTFVILDNSGLLPALHEEGRLLNLTPFVDQDAAFDLEDFYPSTVSSCRLEGQMWAVPASIDLQVLYYNKDLFDQRNVPYPRNGWTWDDFYRIAIAVRDPEQDIYACAPDAMSAIPFIYQHGGRILDRWENPSRTTFDDPLTIDALEWYAKLIHEHDAIPTLEELAKMTGSNPSAAFLWVRGRSGMYFGSLWDKGGETWGRQGRWTWQWGMVTLPQDRAQATMGFVQSYAISSQTEHPDACWEWVSFLSEQMHHRLMPARRSLAESEEYEEQAGADEAEVTRGSVDHALVLFASHARLQEVSEQYAQVFESIANGEMEAMDALIQAQEQSTFK